MRARVEVVVGDHLDEHGHKLLSPEHLGELVYDLAERDVFISGPPGMVGTIEKNVRHAGVRAPADSQRALRALRGLEIARARITAVVSAFVLILPTVGAVAAPSKKVVTQWKQGARYRRAGRPLGRGAGRARHPQSGRRSLTARSGLSRRVTAVRLPVWPDRAARTQFS